MRNGTATDLAKGIAIAVLAILISVWMIFSQDDQRRTLPDLQQITNLRGPSQQQALQSFLEATKSGDEIFYHESQLRSALRALIYAPNVSQNVSHKALSFLALIGVTEDLQFIIDNPPKTTWMYHRWAYDVASSLLEPTSDKEWAFLQKCALDGWDDPSVVRAGIQTLKLIASLRSREILEEAQRQKQEWKGTITTALEYIGSGPAPLSSYSVEELADRVAQIVKIGEWRGTGQPRYNRSHDKALVDFNFRAVRDGYIYTATFHRERFVWKLAGVRETLQELYAPPLDRLLPLK